METSLLTVVIANYNYGAFLESAILSVLQQCYTPIKDDLGRRVLPIKGSAATVELVICDAASTDNSLEIIKKYAGSLTWWCSEHDSGQSEAFNKGFKHGKGKYLTWLNADEQYLKGTLFALSERIKKKKYPPWITGNYVEFYTDSKRIRRVSWGPHFQPHFLTGKKRGGVAVFGPSSFIRRDVFEKIGPIDESLQYTMDLDYWTRLNLAGICQTRLNRMCWAFGVHPQSKSTGYWAQPENTLRSPGHKENVDREKKYDYHYKYSIRNPWYCVWLFFRILDGSLFVRAWKKFWLPGRVYDLESCTIAK